MRFLSLASLVALCASAEPLQASVHLSVKSSTLTYFAQVVQDGEACNYVDSVLPMCASKNFVCRMESGHEMDAYAPSCLEYLPDEMQDNPFEVEETAVSPWGNCDPAAELHRQIGDAPICKRDFQCLCLHGAGGTCVCAPPDAVDDASGGSTCGGKGCAEEEYCHYQQKGSVTCGPKPYFK